MSEQRFDAFVREAAAAVSRRSSLKTLGAAALAAGLVGPALTEAKGSGKKKARKKCSKSEKQCRNLLLAQPDTNPKIIPCCKHCVTGQFVACVVAAQKE
jgi:hypothetical protein